MDDFVVNVRQVGNYPRQDFIGANDLLLVQQGGIGGPYASITQDALLGQVYERVNVGILPAPDNQGIASSYLITPLGQRQGFNWYVDEDGIQRYLQNGVAGYCSFDGVNLKWAVSPSGEKDDPIDTTAWTPIFAIGAGAGGIMSVTSITITGTPTAPTDAVTVAWVQAHTVASFNGRIGPVTLTLADVTGVGGAPIASPNFTGTPHAPTAASPAQADTQIANTSWVQGAISAGFTNFISTHPTVSTFNGRTGVVTLTLADVTGVGGAPLASPVFTGTPAAPTPPVSDNTTKIATTAFVATSFLTIANAGTIYAPLISPGFAGVPTAPTAAPGNSTGQLATTAFVTAAVVASTTGVVSFNTRIGAIVLNLADVTGAGGAPIVSPSFTGVPLAPTPSPGDNSGKIATTSFVTAAISAATAGVATWNGRSGTVVMTGADVTGAGGALLASPAFSGTPTAPTEPPGDNSTKLATTAFVTAAVAAAGGVSTFNTRTGAVSLQANDLSAVGGALLAGPIFTGVPVAPTATVGTNTTQLATCAFVLAALAAAGGVVSFNARAGAVVLNTADITSAGGAPINSPILTGTPAAPTLAPGNNSTGLATTAFVTAAIAAIPASGVVSFNTRTGAVVLTGADITNAGGALLASPPLSGTPTAPTAASGTNTTQIATTAYVQGTSIPSGNIVGQDADFSTSITLAASDNGKIKNCTAASAVNVTCPNNLPKDFYCTINQTGAGVIAFVAGSGATVRNRQSFTHSAGQWAICCLLVSANAGGTAANYIVGGDMVT